MFGVSVTERSERVVGKSSRIMSVNFSESVNSDSQGITVIKSRNGDRGLQIKLKRVLIYRTNRILGSIVYIV